MIKGSMVEFLIWLTVVSKTECYRFLPERENESYLYKGYVDLVTNITDVPHHVQIVYGSSYCSGSIIGSRIVVTVASCFDNNKNEPVLVKFGSNSMTSSGQVISVAEYKIHEYYKYSHSFDNDIALVMLRDHVVFGINVVKTLLVESEIALRIGTLVTVTGWGGSVSILIMTRFVDLDSLKYSLPSNGRTQELSIKYVNFILQSEMVVVDKIECLKQIGRFMTPSNFCGKYVLEGRLSDNGGGALYNKFLLVGILSYGTSKPIYNTAIFTNVSYFYRWITLNSRRFLNKYCRVKHINGKVPDNIEYIESYK